MGKKGWDKVPASKGLERNESTLDQAKRFLIVCEGKETEPNYFDHFDSARVSVKTVGHKGQWRKVVEAAEAIRDDSEDNYEEVWCVSDRDIDGENPNAKDLFCQALDLASARGFKVAYSIDAFELWFLLHFQFYDTSTLRKDYLSMLTAQFTASGIKKPYDKSDPMLYYDLLDRQPTALRNAKKLHTQTHNGTDKYENDPSTTVYLLVEALIKDQ